MSYFAEIAIESGDVRGRENLPSDDPGVPTDMIRCRDPYGLRWWSIGFVAGLI